MPEEKHISVSVLDFKSSQTIIAIIVVLEWLKKLNTS
jgi:hypothetical protein